MPVSTQSNNRTHRIKVPPEREPGRPVARGRAGVKTFVMEGSRKKSHCISRLLDVNGFLVCPEKCGVVLLLGRFLLQGCSFFLFMFIRRTLHKAIEHKTYTFVSTWSFAQLCSYSCLLGALHFPLSSSACERSWEVGSWASHKGGKFLSNACVET